MRLLVAALLVGGIAWAAPAPRGADVARAGGGYPGGDDPVATALRLADADRLAGVPGWSSRMREAAGWSEQLGDRAKAAKILAQVLANPETTFDQSEAHRMLAQSAFLAGNASEAALQYERALELLRQTGELPGLYDALAASIKTNLGLAYRDLGKIEDSRRVSEEVLAMDGSRIDRFSIAAALANKGDLAARSGDFASATHLLDLRIARYAGEPSAYEEQIALARDEFASKAGLPNALEVRLGMQVERLTSPGAVVEASMAALGLLEYYQREERRQDLYPLALALVDDANRVLASSNTFTASDRRAANGLRSTCLSVLSTADLFGFRDHAIEAIIEYILTDTDPRMLEQHKIELDELLFSP